MYYYRDCGVNLVSLTPVDGLGPTIDPVTRGPLFALTRSDQAVGRGNFRVTHPGQLAAPNGLEVLDESRLPDTQVDGATAAAIAEGRLTAVNRARTNWKSTLNNPWKSGKKRLNLLAVGDVGSTMLIGLKLLGGDVLSSIGICDLSDQVTARWEFEMGQISLPWQYDTMPEVEVVTPDRLFDCDVFVFVASKGIPPVGSQVGDVRMAQFEANRKIVKQYAKMARNAKFQGLWCAVSDPVDPLARTAYLESNRAEDGFWDGQGLRPEQVQGYGLGVMNARAAYYAKRDSRFASFLTEGRAFGPHGTGLTIANSVEHYDEELSQELTNLTVNANMQMRQIGYKPYVAPALSSGALSILATIRGEWHYGSVLLNGVYLGVKNRYTPSGLETELLPHIPDPLLGHIQEAVGHLEGIL
jgi:hypothetical protein